MFEHDLAPGLLLASPSLKDSNFEKTVVLLGRHSSDGALGWVLNGRELMSVRELFTSSQAVSSGLVVPEGGPFARSACVGGPVAPAAGWLIYTRTFESPLPGEIPVGPDLGVSGELEAFTTVVRGGGPGQPVPAGARLRGLGARPARERDQRRRLAARVDRPDAGLRRAAGVGVGRRVPQRGRRRARRVHQHAGQGVIAQYR